MLNKVTWEGRPYTCRSWELTDQDWEHVRSVVLDGALYLTRALIGPMVENKYGNILFFVGDGAYSGRGSGRAHLSAAKMALVGLARGLASEFAPHNIRVNVVSPGSIDTRRDNPEWYGNRPPTLPASRSGGKGRSTRSPRPACSWSATAAGSSPARPSTSTEVPVIIEARRLSLKSAMGNSTPPSQRDRATMSEGSRLLWPGPKLACPARSRATLDRRGPGRGRQVGDRHGRRQD